MVKKAKKVKRHKPVRGVKKSYEQVKKDLKLFETGVSRLKQLERELNRLDTRGFYVEEKTIRRKLKNVSDIPVIEKRIKTLRLKINKKYKPKIRKKRSAVVEQLKQLNKKVEVMSKKPRVDSKVGDAVNSEFGEFLNDVKGKLSNEARRKQREMKKALKIKLVEKNIVFKYKQKELEREFRKNKVKLEKEISEKKKKLDERAKVRVKNKIKSLKKKFKVKKKKIKVEKKKKVKKSKAVIKKIGKQILSYSEKQDIEVEVRAIENRINKKLDRVKV